MKSEHRHIGDKEKYDCDTCGFTFYKKDMLKQNGYWVCRDCYDEPSYRDNRKRKIR